MEKGREIQGNENCNNTAKAIYFIIKVNTKPPLPRFTLHIPSLFCIELLQTWTYIYCYLTFDIIALILTCDRFRFGHLIR